jgi:hypothetical protein
MDKDIDTEHLKESLKDGGSWLRLLFMVLFSVIYSVAEVVVFQFLCVLLTGNRNDKALSLGAQLSTFIYQVLRYLTYNSDERPYPFADWPCDATLAKQQEKRASQTKKPAAPAVKKTPAKRKAAPASRKKTVEENPASSD